MTLVRGSRESWNLVHRAQNRGALSGSDPVDVLTGHCLLDLIRPGLAVLDIGVGLGGMSRYLSGRGCLVDALDVSDVAEATVESYVRCFYLDGPELHLDERYDLAVSHLVSQHQEEAVLRRQVRGVYRALKPGGGVLSIQFAGSSNTVRTPVNLTGEIPEGLDGAMCRTEEYAADLLRTETDDKAVIELVGERFEWPEFETYWYFMRVTRP